MHGVRWRTGGELVVTSAVELRFRLYAIRVMCDTYSWKMGIHAIRPGNWYEYLTDTSTPARQYLFWVYNDSMTKQK